MFEFDGGFKINIHSSSIGAEPKIFLVVHINKTHVIIPQTGWITYTFTIPFELLRDRGEPGEPVIHAADPEITVLVLINGSDRVPGKMFEVVQVIRRDMRFDHFTEIGIEQQHSSAIGTHIYFSVLIEEKCAGIVGFIERGGRRIVVEGKIILVVFSGSGIICIEPEAIGAEPQAVLLIAEDGAHGQILLRDIRSGKGSFPRIKMHQAHLGAEPYRSILIRKNGANGVIVHVMAFSGRIVMRKNIVGGVVRIKPAVGAHPKGVVLIHVKAIDEIIGEGVVVLGIMTENRDGVTVIPVKSILRSEP